MRTLHNSAKMLGLYGVAVASALCCAILAARLHVADDGLFRFMIWNLFLGLIPFGLSVVMVGADRLRRARWLLMPPLLVGWLVFLPNAPYLLTDLIHLKPRASIPLWYDNAMFGMFGFTGMLIGVRSLAHVHGLVEKHLGRLIGWLFATQVTLLCGLGIYLGRFERWNSWDLATRPEAVVADLAHQLLNPMSHPRTWGVTLVFGACMLAAYVALRPDRGRPAASTAATDP
ncbi:MAG: putative membrane protein [Myxococcota bacterium]|jgi:uncharacterized membrane protein